MSVKILKNYLSLIKFSHTIFAMPFALLGYFTALHYGNGQFSWRIFIGVILCMIFARSAAMAFNRYLDRDIDSKNSRTAIREIPAGLLKADSVLWFVIMNSLFFICVTFFMNLLVFLLSPIALLIILGYSYTKRFTHLCHIVLGLGLSLAPIGAYLAVTGSFALLPVLYSLSVLFWVGGFDILYALQDESFDKENHLFSIPSRFGIKKSLWISIIIHVFSIVFLILAGLLNNQGLLYWIGLGIFILFLVYQHAIVKPNDISKINLAFATANGFASILFCIFAIADMYFIL